MSPILRHCPCGGETMGAASHNSRTITTLEAVWRLTRQLRRCFHAHCPQVHTPYRPEAAGRLVLPTHAFGRDVLAFVGSRRSAHPRRLPDIPQALIARGVAVAQRPVTTLLERYDALLRLTLQDPERLQRLPAPHGRVIFALAGVQPDGGHAVLWGWRDGRSGDVVWAHSWLSASYPDLAALWQRGKHALRVPMVAVVSAGHRAMRQAVPPAWPQTPHPLGHCHDLRAAATPIYAADRQAKQARKTRGRGVRPLARQGETRSAPEADVIRGDGRAVRRALTEDGRPPVAASGLTLH